MGWQYHNGSPCAAGTLVVTAGLTPTAVTPGAVISMHFRVPRALAGMSVIALIALAACQPAAPASQPTTAAAKPTTAPAAPAGSPAASPSPAPKPAASHSPVASPSPAALAQPTPVTYSRPQAASPTGNQKGSADNPINMAFVPATDSQRVLALGEPLAALLKDPTGLTFRVSVPTSYAGVIEAIGAGQVDVGWLAPFAYVLARDRHGVEVQLASIRMGSKTYRSQIVVRADSGIDNLDQLRGKRFAFVEPGSVSGFIFPNALLAQRGIDYRQFFSDTTFTGGHDRAIVAVYNRQVDGAATFGNSIEAGPPSDARTLLTSTLPDVMQVIRPIAQTDPIPNDTVATRRGLDETIGQLVKNGLLYVQGTAEGQRVLRDLYNINGLAPATDTDFDSVRAAARALNLDLEEQLAPPKPKT